MKPPSDLLRAVTGYDATLALRWMKRSQMWAVVKTPDPRVGQLLRECPKPFKSPRGLDLLDIWREGLDHVMSIHPFYAQNIPLVLEHLREADTWRTGGREAVLRKLDALDAETEKAAERFTANVIEERTSEAYDVLAWKLGNRVAVTNPVPEIGEEREGYRVLDRRVSV